MTSCQIDKQTDMDINRVALLLIANMVLSLKVPNPLWCLNHAGLSCTQYNLTKGKTHEIREERGSVVYCHF